MSHSPTKSGDPSHTPLYPWEHYHHHTNSCSACTSRWNPPPSQCQDIQILQDMPSVPKYPLLSYRSAYRILPRGKSLASMRLPHKNLKQTLHQKYLLSPVSHPPEIMWTHLHQGSHSDSPEISKKMLIIVHSQYD